MKLKVVTLTLIAVSLVSVQSEPKGKNIALRRPVYGNLVNAKHITDGNVDWDAKGMMHSQPYWFIDLGAVYKIHTIQLYTRGNVVEGHNIPFTIYSWEQFTSICDLLPLYPWKTVKSGLVSNQTRGMQEISTDFEAHFIIVMTDRKDQLESAMTISLSELKVFGEKTRDTYHSFYSLDNKTVTNTYIEHRRKIASGQTSFWVEQNLGQFVPNYDMNDVAIGWHDHKVNTMAVTRGKGRILMLSGKTGMNRVVSEKDYEPIRNGAKSWLADGQTDAKFEPVSDTPTKGAILLITRDDKFDVDKIYQLISTGENSAMFGYVHQGTQEDNASSLMAKLKIDHLRTNLRYMGRNINLNVLIENQEFIPAELMLELALENWNALTDSNFLSRVSQAEVEQPKFQQLLKQVLTKYRDYIHFYTPCDFRFRSPEGKDHAAVANLNKLYLHQTQKPIMVLPGSSRHPGYISPELKSDSYTVTLKSPNVTNRFIPVGAWAKAGGDARYKVIKASDSTLKGFSLRVNPQTDNLCRLSIYKRWPIVTSSVYLKQEGEIHTAIGGPIVLSIPRDQEITIEFENVYRHPWLDIRDPKSVNNWEAEQKKYKHTPFTMIMGDAMITMLQMDLAQKMNKSHISWIINYFDNTVKIMHNYRGSEIREYPMQIFVVDAQISIGWGHSGYPFMGQLPWTQCFYNLHYIKNRQCNGIPHEIGHNLQLHGMTLKGGTEVTNTLFLPVVYKYQLNASSFDFGQWPGFSKGEMEGLVKQWKSGEYQNVQTAFYSYFGRHFTPALLANCLSNVLHTKQPLNTEERKVNFWVQQLCKESQYDLLPFCNMWHLPINKETEEICKPFPCFIPDDELTKQAPEVVDEVIKKSGKQCIRSNPKHVQYKIPVLRGLNENVEPIVHFH